MIAPIMTFMNYSIKHLTPKLIIMFIRSKSRKQLEDIQANAVRQGDPTKKLALTIMRTPTGVPKVVTSDPVDGKYSEHSILGLVIGYPISNAQEQAILSAPERRFIITNFLKFLRSKTVFQVAVTSHDQSRNGAKRSKSEGHLSGSSTDFIILIEDPETHKRYNVLDTMDSIAYATFLADVASEFHALYQPHFANFSKPLIIGCEFDHTHIEWPWADRAIPMQPATIRIPSIPAGIVVGSFYNPQLSYGMPQVRSSNPEKILSTF